MFGRKKKRMYEVELSFHNSRMQKKHYMQCLS